MLEYYLISINVQSSRGNEWTWSSVESIPKRGKVWRSRAATVWRIRRRCVWVWSCGVRWWRSPVWCRNSPTSFRHKGCNVKTMSPANRTEIAHLLHPDAILATYPQTGVVVRVLHHLAEDQVQSQRVDQRLRRRKQLHVEDQDRCKLISWRELMCISIGVPLSWRAGSTALCCTWRRAHSTGRRVSCGCSPEPGWPVRRRRRRPSCAGRPIEAHRPRKATDLKSVTTSVHC